MPGYAHAEALVTTEWLAAKLGDPGLVILDARFGSSGPLRGEYEAGHVPGAVFVDLMAFRRVGATRLTRPRPVQLALMALRLGKAGIAEPARVEAALRKVGVSNESTIVVYDQEFGAWAAYVWWVLRYHGHDDVRLLDGGYEKWLAEERPVERGARAVAKGRFASRPRPELRASLDDVLAAVRHGGATIVDALPGKIYRGERRMFPTHRRGHIPGAKNVSAPSNIDRATDRLLPPDELARVWSRLHLEGSPRTIAYCGAGPYAAFDLFALYLLGHDEAALYDGAWLEWGARRDLPVELGPER